jgi:NTE family protein
MQSANTQVGLVLVGGGAKGAYQAGALKYLAEETAIEPQIIAGTSIGALNGAV